jgi:hypothetical protein
MASGIASHSGQGNTQRVTAINHLAHYFFHTRLISELCTMAASALGGKLRVTPQTVDKIMTMQASFKDLEVFVTLGDSPQSRCIAHQLNADALR